MSLKSKAIKLATKKITKSKTARKAIKTGITTSLLVGGAFGAYTLALNGKIIEEKKEKSE